MVPSAVRSKSISPSVLRISSALAALALLIACGGSKAPVAARPAPVVQGPPKEAVDLLFVDGDIWTMDEALPHARAMALRGDSIVWVGDDDGAEKFQAARTIDLRGRSVTPGLVDGHCHLAELGASLDEISLKGAASEAEAVQRVSAAPPGGGDEWIRGLGWDQNLWPGGAFPTRAALDAAVPARPVALSRIDGHALWVNGTALARAGITRATKDPAGGRIVRDKRGEPTGVLVDNAMALVEAKIPPPSDEVRDRQILTAAGAAIAAGLTGVHEMGIDDATVAAYRRLVADGRLPLRVYALLRGVPAEAEALRSRAPDSDPDGRALFTLRAVKFFADGALGSRGARLRAPYTDDPKNRGLWVTEPKALTRAVDAAVAGGWQVATHAIGDAAVGAVIDAYAAALAAHAAGEASVAGSGPGDRRLRIEHTQVIGDADIPRMASFGIIASMQPTHATSDMPWAEARLGPQRIRGAYAWRRLLDAKIRIVAGSDFPIEEVSPLLGIYAAVSRQDGHGQPAGGWYPLQRMTLDEAIRAFTVEPAFASFAEAHRGRLRAGQIADVTVYDRALVGDAGLLETRIDLTIVGGRVVYERGK
jgi:predicted amidohydrolase YtcJ